MSVTFTAWDPSLDRFIQASDMDGYRAARPADMWAVDCNFHNAGAVDTLRLLGLPAEPYGRVPAVDLPAVRRAIIGARNLSGRRAPFVHDGGTEGRVHWGSQPDALILDRLDRLDAVIGHCLDHGWDLSWG